MVEKEDLMERLQNYIQHLEKKLKDNNPRVNKSERLDRTIEMGVRCTAYGEDIKDLYEFVPELKKYNIKSEEGNRNKK